MSGRYGTAVALWVSKTQEAGLPSIGHRKNRIGKVMNDIYKGYFLFLLLVLINSCVNEKSIDVGEEKSMVKQKDTRVWIDFTEKIDKPNEEKLYLLRLMDAKGYIFPNVASF